MAQMPQGFYWHVHHDVLFEFCHNYGERASYIRGNKAESEQAIRLKLFQPVKGELPEEVVKARQAYDQARQAHIQAWQAYDQAWQAYDQARQAHIQAWQAYDQARQAYDQARQAYDQARQAYIQAWQAYTQAWRAREQAEQAYDKTVANNIEAIKKLHSIECPNCPWDGHTIFPNQ